jgi:predicted DNA-binding mobile mystery protein A
MKTEFRAIVLSGLDKQIPAMRQAQLTVAVPTRGWLRAIRESLGMAQRSVGAAMGMKQQAYRLLEQREMLGAATIDTLRRAANALDCDFVYFLVPKQRSGRTFSDLAATHDPQYSNRLATEHSMALEGQGLRVEEPGAPDLPAP